MRNWYRYAEKILHRYSDTTEELKSLAAELYELDKSGDVSAQAYTQFKQSEGGSSDPVLRHVGKIIQLEARINKLSKRVKAIDTMRKALLSKSVKTIANPRNLLRILEGYYISKLPMSLFLLETRWSRSLFYALRRELVTIAGDYLRS